MVTIGVASLSMAPGLLKSRRVVAQQPAVAGQPVQDYLGPGGIDADRLHQPPYDLRGRKIAIGQVEPGRPGLFGYDKNVATGRQGLALAGIFFRDRPVQPNAFLDAHAHGVASVMVGQDKTVRGVAPEARLYAGALGSRQFRGGQPEECLTATHIAQQNGGDVRAINLSFGESLRLDRRSVPVLDGNALLTQCIDWLAQEYNSLFVVAGNQGKGGIPIPTDQFNGLTVAYSRPEADGIYRKVDFANLGDEMAGLEHRFIGVERNLNDRNSIGLIAPGRQLNTLLFNGDNRSLSGTSFAAPQVTAAVALLQEYGDRRLRQVHSASQTEPKVASNQHWSLDSRRPEVMKAVLLNAADKLEDAGKGDRLAMTKTILSQNNRDWLSSPAHRNPRLPLDPLFGAGQLNLMRAYQQFSAGQFASPSPESARESAGLPARGWDYNQVGLEVHPPYRDYPLTEPLRQGSYLAVTLAWNRRVELVDQDNSGSYSLGDRFEDRGLNDLNLYLLPIDENNNSRSLWASRSSVDSVEHLFQRIPTTGRYKIRVQYERQVNRPTQAYALAWWGAAASAQLGK